MNGHELIKMLQEMSDAQLNLEVGSVYYENIDDDADKPMFPIKAVSVQASENSYGESKYIIVIE